MEVKKLKYPPCLNPLFMRGLPAEATVENGKVKVFSEVLEFIGEVYPDGTRVKVSSNQYWLNCQSFTDIEREQRAIMDRIMAQEKEREEKEIERRREAKEFNESLLIPVLWSPDNKVVMSGLGANSSGNGCFSKTVFHIVLREGLCLGRLKRNKFDYLCTQPKAKHSLHATEFWGDAPPTLDSAKVNCKQCLAVAERIKPTV